MLGVLSPTQGNVLISGMLPSQAIENWPGAVGYVPQDTVMISGTIRENIALGFPKTEYKENLFKSAVENAQLSEFESALPAGLDSIVGERGSRISGGQRQRLGIARALYTNPKLIVLDEATSSLDGKTESEVSKAIQALKGRVTVIMIAHRLSTVRTADVVCYLESGELLAAGTFEHVRREIPEFDQQAKLMGL
jgi:ABC-type multidrug transport system fused ATPase/permease subunit